MTVLGMQECPQRKLLFDVAMEVVQGRRHGGLFHRPLKEVLEEYQDHRPRKGWSCVDGGRGSPCHPIASCRPVPFDFPKLSMPSLFLSWNGVSTIHERHRRTRLFRMTAGALKSSTTKESIQDRECKRKAGGCRHWSMPKGFLTCPCLIPER